MTTEDPQALAINTIRTLAIDMVQAANSGHPGLPLGCAPMAYTLWQRHLKHDPKDPAWFDRDRFVLSAGHGSTLLYSLLHLTGYDLSLDELKHFRQWGSKTPGHPEWHHTKGVEATTGPLGQGAANAVGMALAERYLAKHFNREGHAIIDHMTYALVSDGDVMEGVAYEAASFAGHLGLGKLIYLYDANQITLDGPLGLIMSEDVGARYAACGWQVLKVERGDTDLGAIDGAIAAAKADTDRPSIIIVRTTIGYGSPKKAGTSSAHGSPLGEAEVAATKTALGWDPAAKFFIPDAARAHLGEAVRKGSAAHNAWRERFNHYKATYPELAAELDAAIAGKLPAGWEAELDSVKFEKPIATRSSAGKALEKLCAKIPTLFGGDADLGGSTKTIVPGGDYDRAGNGRNIRFGIREHAMGAIANGLLYHGGLRTYVATFFVFSDYMRPSVRLAALNGLPAVYVWTHDSIGLGEDGPTHQAVEHLMALRAMPNLHVVRPADGYESVAAWKHALTRTDGPTALVLSRQDLPVVTKPGAAGAERGAYVLADGTDCTIIATGSEVSIALEARAALAKDHQINARVVSMPCWELFADQDVAYQASVLGDDSKPRISVEAGVTFGWREYVGAKGASIGMNRYGASAPGEVLFEKFGITAAAIVATVRGLVRPQ